jgi:hypothetical protein
VREEAQTIDTCVQYNEFKCSSDGICECIDPAKTIVNSKCVKLCFDYVFSEDTLNWNDANTKCKSRGGTLANARDHKIENLQNLQPPDFIRWIGARTETLNGNWSWLSGEYLPINETSNSVLW